MKRLQDVGESNEVKVVPTHPTESQRSAVNLISTIDSTVNRYCYCESRTWHGLYILVSLLLLPDVPREPLSSTVQDAQT